MISSDMLERGQQTSLYRRALYSCQLGVGFGLAAIIVGADRMVVVGIASIAMTLTLVEHAISRRLGHKSVDLVHEQEALLEEAQRSRHQIEQLFEMADMLQSAENHADAGAVLQATSLRLLPDFSGALYVFNNSRDRLDLTNSWSASEVFAPAETLVPANCWALKRGKLHLNDMSAGTLCCLHHGGKAATMELPMVARGTIHGLLMLAAPDGARLRKEARVGRAIADSMSLALSNIALREKLRTQSLRDPLTGLYNRRYMEDALERYLSMSERAGAHTSVIMIDLDQFKLLNDEHGHAKGDAVLREVAAQLVGALRPSDVVSRYGGEELLIILPSCNLDDALLRAEMLRSRIESLSETHGAAITASFGVASVPETSIGPSDVVAMADAALYAAKQSGRNCVKAAARREKETHKPRLAVG
jgi:diguanylate cyclase (GGDEF)-like protein